MTRPNPHPAQESARHHALAVVLRSLHMLEALTVACFVFAREWLRAEGSMAARVQRAAGRALVRLASSLGATFIKVGQIASTRADLLPGPLRDELVTLQDRVPAFAFEQVRATIEADFGQPIETLFAELDPKPVAAASVAQVHRARLREGGTVVAVKVRRPDVLEKVRLDRAILLALSRVLERIVPSLRLVSLEEAMRTFCDAVEEQIHLGNEAEHNRRFRENFADDPDVRFPELVPALCSDAVLTMEFIEGVREEDLVARGVDVHRVIEAGMRGVCRMIFRDGFVHADLHPGNLRFRPPHEIVLLDLGLVGRLEERDRLTTVRLFYALASGDGRTVARLFYENAPHHNTPDYGAYEAEIVALVDAVQRRGLANLEITAEIGRIFDTLRRHRIQARSHMTMVNLAMLTAEGLGKRLAPDLSLNEEALPYLAEALGIAPPANGAAAT